MSHSDDITHRRVLNLAIPIVLSNATVPILGAVDVAVVGQIGEAAPIGAVGMGAIILTTLYWFFGFLRMGTAGLVGQAAGAGNASEVSAILTRALLIAGAAGLGLIVLQSLLFRGAFMVSPASDEVERMARGYLAIRIWTAPFAIAVYALTGWLIAMERTRHVFVIQFAMNGINILLDLWFVLGLGWGVEGVALATVIAEVLGAALALWFCRDAFDTPAWRNWPQVFDRQKLVTMMVLNLDILIRSAMLMAMMTSFVFLGARFGDVTLAANEVLLQFIYIVAYALDGFAFAAEALVARSLGQRDRAALFKSAKYCSLWGVLICCVMAAGFALGGGLLIDVMAKSAEVQSTARIYLFWVALAPILGVGAWMLDGIFIGAMRGRDMRNMMAISFVAYLAAVAILLPSFGNHGLWAALVMSYVVRGVTLGLRFPALLRSAA